MEKRKDVLRPKLWKTIRNYSGAQLVKDVVAAPVTNATAAIDVEVILPQAH